MFHSPQLVQLRTLLEREKSEGLVARAANKEIEAKVCLSLSGKHRGTIHPAAHCTQFSRQLEDQENIWRQKLARVSSEYAPALDKLSKKMEVFYTKMAPLSFPCVPAQPYTSRDKSMLPLTLLSMPRRSWETTSLCWSA